MSKSNSELVATRVTKEEKEHLNKLRKEDKAGLNMTQFIRRVLREYLAERKEGNG